MARIVYALVLVFVIEAALFFFAGTTYTTSSLFNMFSNPADILNNPLYLLLAGAITLMVASQIIPGNFFQINIYGVYASMIVIIITFVSSIFRLATFMHGQLAPMFGCNPYTGILTCSPSAFIIMILTVPIGIVYLMACIEWMRFNN